MKWRYYICVALACSCGIFVFRFFGSKKLDSHKSVIQLPIHYLSFLNEPCIEVKIEGKKYHVLLDTGQGPSLRFPQRILDAIQDKKLVSEYESFDVNGNHYLSQGYQIPEIQIGDNLTIQNAVAREEHAYFINQGSRLAPLKLSDKIWNWLDGLLREGSLGIGVLRGAVCYFDFPDATFYMAKDLLTLTQALGFSLTHFVQVPFTLEECGAVLQFETDWGRKKFLLDTGANVSILSDLLDQKIAVTNHLVLEDCDLGPWTFKTFRISSSLPNFDGILGSDFFKEHLVCIDFPAQIAYIQPAIAF